MINNLVNCIVNIDQSNGFDTCSIDDLLALKIAATDFLVKIRKVNISDKLNHDLEFAMISITEILDNHVKTKELKFNASLYMKCIENNGSTLRLKVFDKFFEMTKYHKFNVFTETSNGTANVFITLDGSFESTFAIPKTDLQYIETPLFIIQLENYGKH